MARRARRRKSPAVLIFGLALAAVLLLLTAGFFGYLALRAYLRGDEFRQLVAREAGRHLHAELELAPLTWTGSSVYADSASATGEAGSSVERMTGANLRTGVELRALLGREVRLQPLEITRLDLTLRPPAPRPPELEVPPAKPRAWWQPKRIVLDSVLAQQLTVRSPWFELTGARAALQLEPTKDVALTGGTLRLPGLPDFQQEETRVRFIGDEVHILDSRSRTGDSGEVEASGVIGGVGGFDLQTKWTGVDLAHFLPEAWREVLRGHVSGTAHCTRQNDIAEISGSIRSTDSSVGLLPVLKLLQDFTGSERFAHVPLQELSADFTKKDARLELTNIAVESSGLLRLEGTCTTDGETIDGSFQVGVSPSVLRWIPGGYGKVFEENRAGYRWTPLRVSGPLSHPTEDLSARLIAAIPGEVIDQAVEGAGQAEKVLKDGVKGVLDTILGF